MKEEEGRPRCCCYRVSSVVRLLEGEFFVLPLSTADYGIIRMILTVYLFSTGTRKYQPVLLIP